ncbi:MAG: transglutaminase-like domain-containing protein [Myxococcales bacterium]
MRTHDSTRVATGAWALTAAVGLLTAGPALGASFPRGLDVPRPAAGEWMGIYLLGHKAGYSFDQLLLAERNGKPVIVAVDDTTLRATLGGKDVSRRVREERTYEAKSHGRLIHFEAVHTGDGGDETLSGDCDSSGVHLVRRRAGQPDEKLDLPPSEDVVETADLPRLAAARKTTLEGEAFDGQSLRDKPQKAEYRGEGELIAGGVHTKVSRVAVTEDRGKLSAEVAIGRKDGRVLRLEFGGALLAVPEPEALAKKLDSVDLFALTRVAIDQPLPSGVVPETIRYRIAGLPAAIRPAPERQSYQDLPDGAVAVTVRASLPHPEPLAPAVPPAARRDLRATPDIESDAPEIRTLSQQIVGDEKDPFRAATRLSDWVYRHLRKAYGASSDRATDVLHRREGDCTEHSLLTVALARAAHVPARLVHGLVYAQGSDQVYGLYWHEWVEVWARGGWIAIDPTFGQEVADATHIELGEGDETDAVALMGQLRVSVLERSPQ